jgi:hypothetical protein
MKFLDDLIDCLDADVLDEDYPIGDVDRELAEYGIGPSSSPASPTNPGLSPAGEPLSAADYQILLARSLAGLERAANDAANLMYLARFNPDVYDEYIRRKSR